MLRRELAVGLGLVMGLVLTAPRDLWAQQSCLQVGDQLERDFDRLVRDAKREGFDDLVDMGGKAVVGDMKKSIIAHAGPQVETAETASQFKSQMDIYTGRLTEIEKLQKTFQVTADRMMQCLLANKGGCGDLITAQSDAWKRWIQALLSGTTQQAIDRAQKAKSILSNFTKGAASNATNGISGFINCSKDIVTKAVSSATPVTPGGPPSLPPPKTTAAPSGGGVGTAAKVGIGVAAAGAGAAVALRGASKSGSGGGGSSSAGGSSSGGSLPLFAGAQNQFVCDPPSALNTRNCSGSMIVRVEAPLVEGNRYVIQTLEGGFHGVFTASARGSLVNGISVTTTTVGCPATPTLAGFYNEFQTNTAIATVSLSMPAVLCR